MQNIFIWGFLVIAAFALYGYLTPEEVDAFYYPNPNDLTKHIEVKGLKSVEACREAVRNIAAAYGDPDITRGDYECGVGFKEKMGELNVYRETVR